MILVDTSVIIDKLRKVENSKTLLLDKLHQTKTPFGISIYTYHEVLQGAKTEVEFNKLESYFSTQRILFVPNNVKVYSGSAKLFFDLRKRGVTIRNTIDVLIAFTAIINQIPLLHNDKDFDFMAEKIPELKILN